MAQSVYTVAAYGLDSHDDVWVRSVINIIIDRLPGRWHFVDVAQAQIVLTNSSGYLDLERVEREQQYIVIQGDDEQAIPGTLALNPPLKTLALKKLLEFCCNKLQPHSINNNLQHGSNEDTEDADGHIKLPERFEYINTIHEYVISHHHVEVLVSGKKAFHIDADTRVLNHINDDKPYSHISEVVQFLLSINPSDILILQTNQSKPAHVNGQHPEWGQHSEWDWEAVCWALGREVYGLKLINFYNQNMIHHIYRWPDFGSLEWQQKDLLMASALSQTFLSIADVSIVADVTEADVCRFLTSCMFCNFIVTKQPSAEAPQKVVSELKKESVASTAKGVIGFIRHALGL